MKLLFVLFIGLICIGVFFQEFTGKTRLCVLLLAASVVLYVTLK